MRTTPAQGVTGLARETAMGLGHLISQHLKIAQLEVTGELRAMSRRVRLIAVLAALIMLGYALAMAGLAVVIGGRAAVGIPLVIIGLAHMAGAGTGLVFAPFRARGSHLMGTTSAAVNRSLAALEGATAPPPVPPLEKAHAR